MAFLGALGGPSTTNPWAVYDTDASHDFGFAVGGAGDVNGDGYSDVLIGSPNRDHPSMTDAGSVFVHYGNSRKSAPLAPRFRAHRIGTTTPIAPGGKTGPAYDFDVSFVAKNAAGRSPVRARVQASIHGQPWGPWTLFSYTTDSLARRSSPTRPMSTPTDSWRLPWIRSFRTSN